MTKQSRSPAQNAKTATKPGTKPTLKKSAPQVKAAPAARSVGRPTSYRPEYAELAKKFCLLGANDERLADLFEVAVSTINLWKLTYPEFSESLKAGKEIADANVAHSLYQRALGYSHPEDDIRALNGGIVITPTIKHYPPDTAAATLWLKNRQPNVWRDKVETALTGPDGGPIQSRIAVEFVNAPRREESGE